MIKKLIFIFSIFCCVAPAWGLTLKVMRPGDSTPLEIALHATKRTEHALALKTADGTIYYADMRPVGHSFPGGMFTRVGTRIYQVGVAPSTFSITTTSDTDNFSFTMTAKGTFKVDWGDGQTQMITRTDTSVVTYSHTYSTAGTYIIGFDGRATGYNSKTEVAAISFANNENVAGIHGSLGAIFGTIGDGSGAGQQPGFRGLFSYCTNLTGTIPENLFAGLYGQSVDFMFHSIFTGDIGLTGPLPEKLFADVTGTAGFMFVTAFGNCRGLTGPIPKDLFKNLIGTPRAHMFNAAFQGCSGLTEIPENLFGSMSGTPEFGCFNATFRFCTGLTSIPENLFGDLSGSIDGVFTHLFGECTNLTGPSVRINGKYLYEIWPDATTEQVNRCYRDDVNLSDYADIPNAWK